MTFGASIIVILSWTMLPYKLEMMWMAVQILNSIITEEKDAVGPKECIKQDEFMFISKGQLNARLWMHFYKNKIPPQIRKDNHKV